MKRTHRVVLALVGIILVAVVAFGAGMLLSNPAATANKAAATEPETAFFATVAPTQAPAAEDTIVVVDRTAEASPATVATPAPVPVTPLEPAAVLVPVTPVEPAAILVAATSIPDSDIGDWNVSIPMNAVGLYRRDPDRALTKFRDTAVSNQTSAAAYAKSGLVQGKYANVHALASTYLSTISVVRYEVVNWGFISELHNLNNQQQLVTALMGLVTRTQDNHVTLNCEVYDKNVHIAVANLWVGGQAQEYWTIFVRADGVFTLCCKAGGSSKKAAPSEEPAVPASAPAATPKPQQNVDPAPVFEDASAPETPVGGNDGWDPAFNLPTGNVDPAPVFEGASAPETPVQTSSSSGNTNPAPVFETSSGSTNTNPQAVFEGSTSSASSDTSAQGWDPAFNF